MTNPHRPRPDRGSPPHERAAALLVERLDGPLEMDDAAWLDAHLTSCRACWSLGEAFEADRLELRSLRRQPVDPPRDLWARTAAALEREARTHGTGRRSRRRRAAPAPVGAAAGLLVVAVVVGASILSGRGTITQPQGSIPPPQSSAPLVAVSLEPTATVAPTPEPTRLAVPPGEVPYIADDDGQTSLFVVNVSEVCSEDGANCAPIAPSSPRAIDLPNAPHTVIRSPDEEQLAVVEEGPAGGGGTLVLVAVPTPTASDAAPSVDPTPPASTTPCPSPMPSDCALTPPPATTAPPASASPTATATSSAAPDPSIEPSSTAPASSASVSASPEPASPTPSPSVISSPTPTATAAATPVAIAQDVVVDGTTAAFSADGRFLAFSARPADGSHGPDIYVWATDGTAEAVPMTTDHRSVFAGWIGDSILGSRVVEVPPTGEGASAPVSPSTDASAAPAAVPVHRGEAFVVDPASGAVAVISGRSLWRPAVDPTRSRAVYWDGTLAIDENGNPRAETGRLVIGPWTDPQPPAEAPEASAEASASVAPEGASPLPSAESTVEPLADASATASVEPDGSATADANLDVLAEGPLVDWDARWDETGTHLAVWIADPDDPSIGKLSLYIVDPETGRLATDEAPLRGERALPGFAIGEGRLVWATPPGQNAEGSHVSVLAWTDDGVGQVESHPADGIVVIR